MNQRVAYWDNIKFVIITAVVIGHFADYFVSDFPTFKSIYLFIYAFHMPLFIFISGLFHSDKLIKQKWLFFVSVGLFQKIVLALFSRVSGEIDVSFNLLRDSYTPWFMFVLATFSLMTYLLKDLNKRYILILFIVVGCFIGYDESIGDYLYISRTILFYPYYLLGNLINRENLELQIKNCGLLVKVLAVAALLIWAIVCIIGIDKVYILRDFLTCRNPFPDELLGWGIVVRLGVYLLAVITGISLLVICPVSNLKGISKWGTRTLDVYFWHPICVLILVKWCGISSVFIYGPIGKFVFLIITVLTTILLSQGGIISIPLKKLKYYCYNQEKK